jgi:hypothetical protein
VGAALVLLAVAIGGCAMNRSADMFEEAEAVLSVMLTVEERLRSELGAVTEASNLSLLPVSQMPFRLPFAPTRYRFRIHLSIPFDPAADLDAVITIRTSVLEEAGYRIANERIAVSPGGTNITTSFRPRGTDRPFELFLGATSDGFPLPRGFRDAWDVWDVWEERLGYQSGPLER